MQLPIVFEVSSLLQRFLNTLGDSDEAVNHSWRAPIAKRGETLGPEEIEIASASGPLSQQITINGREFPAG